MKYCAKIENKGRPGSVVWRLVCLLGAALLILSGCKTLEPEPSPGLPMNMPKTFSSQAKSPIPPDLIREWWLSMGSEELNGLIREGLDQSYDLKVLHAKILQARAGLEKENASLKPGLDFSFGGERTHTRTQVSRGQGGETKGGHSWDGSLTGSYTVDAWGKARAATKSSALALDAAQQDYEDAALELTADISGTWVDIISVRNRRKILENQIKLNTTHLELLKLRFLNGRASALDVSQQREALAEALALSPLLEKEEILLLNTLGFLIGRTPGQPISVDTRDLPGPAPLPGPGIPANLLENRADIRAAWMRLLSSRFEVEAAKADLLPSFTLSAKALFSSGQLDLLFHNWVASLGAAVAGPLFDGGEKKAEVKRTRAVVQEQLNLYARTVAKAIQEVEDSLVTLDKQASYIRQLELELETARLTLKDARIQYFNGQSSYLNYLTARVGIEKLERQLVSERAAIIKEEIGFYRVLGWQAPLGSELDQNKEPGQIIGEK